MNYDEDLYPMANYDFDKGLTERQANYINNYRYLSRCFQQDEPNTENEEEYWNVLGDDDEDNDENWYERCC